MITEETREETYMLLSENNFANMLYAIRKFNSVPGKKALQKILYFAKVKSNIYLFNGINMGHIPRS